MGAGETSPLRNVLFATAAGVDPTADSAESSVSTQNIQKILANNFEKTVRNQMAQVNKELDPIMYVTVRVLTAAMLAAVILAVIFCYPSIMLLSICLGVFLGVAIVGIFSVLFIHHAIFLNKAHKKAIKQLLVVDPKNILTQYLFKGRDKKYLKKQITVGLDSLEIPLFQKKFKVSFEKKPLSLKELENRKRELERRPLINIGKLEEKEEREQVERQAQLTEIGNAICIIRDEENNKAKYERYLEILENQFGSQDSTYLHYAGKWVGISAEYLLNESKEKEKVV